jgi:hypothetical protein
MHFKSLRLRELTEFDFDRFVESQAWAGWSADVVSIHMDALVSRRRAREYEGLWMKEPQEFPFDPVARVLRCLQKFPAPSPVSAAAG